MPQNRNNFARDGTRATITQICIIFFRFFPFQPCPGCRARRRAYNSLDDKQGHRRSEDLSFRPAACSRDVIRRPNTSLARGEGCETELNVNNNIVLYVHVYIVQRHIDSSGLASRRTGRVSVFFFFSFMYLFYSFYLFIYFFSFSSTADRRHQSGARVHVKTLHRGRTRARRG